MHERENILRIFKETKEAISKSDIEKIKLLSNQTTNTAALTHDPDNIAAAVVVYSISKIIEKKDKTSCEECEKLIDNIISSIEKKDDKNYRLGIEEIQKSMEKISGKHKSYVEDVLREAKIDKASKIHEHGISMERTASLLGITMYDLANYIGEKKKSSDGDDSDINLAKEVSVKKRIKNVMEMFG